LFGLFILACGTTHLLNIWTIWHPDYYVEGLAKALTAVISMITAILLWPFIPVALRLPSPSSLAHANALLQAEVLEKQKHENHVKLLNEGLEKEVEARTQALIQANHQLSQEITEHQQAKHALKESRENFIRAQEVGKLGWWRMDTVNNILTFSDESYRIFGLPMDKPLTYENFLSSLHPDERDPVHTRWTAALKGEPYDVEYRIIADGATKWVRAKAYLEFGGDNSLLGGFGIVQDVTDRKQAEIALMEADSQKNDFLAMLAHELRNPLTPISNIAQTLGTLPLTEAAIDKSAEMLTRNVNHITHIVDDLLDVSRITRGLVTLNRQPLELGQLLKETAESVQSFFTAKQQTFELHLPAQPIKVDGDSVRLTQVFSNLIINANKYTGEGGRIDLKVITEKEAVVVRIQDNGIGIEPQLLPHIFDLFTQGERTLARSEGGLGIGLTLVKKLVQLHGGEVTATSQGANQGSEFVVKLPIIKEASAEAELAEPQELKKESEQGLRILMIDDNADVLDSISLWLELEGHMVETATNGKQGISLAQSFVPDIILLDIGLPDMDGYQVANKLREQLGNKRPRIIAMSGYGPGQENLRTDAAADFDHYLVKPPKLSELQGLISQCQRAKREGS
jgi:PAS domain S-box-containing protein